jgi:hypothetical protein
VLARVLDLGWDPAALVALRRPGIEVLWAGTFLTARGGYPSTRAWAPPGSVTPLASAEEAVAAVDRQRDALGAHVIKVALNSDAGPVLRDDVLRAIVGRAHETGMAVVAHVEGEGQAERAFLAGVDAFAHTPWTHLLPSDLLREMVGRVRWISTIAIHDSPTVAMDNLARFVALGGDVVYGTDLGNGTTTADLSLPEVAALREAGLEGLRLLGALTGARLLPRWSATATLLPFATDDPAQAVAALPTSRPVDAAALEGCLT